MIGIVAGSFDPITKGHVWLIEKSLAMLGEHGKLHVVIGVNAAKKYYFSQQERIALLEAVLKEALPAPLFEKICIDCITDSLLISHAQAIGATHIFRGIRNTEDFNYEFQVLQVNRKICPDVETVFFMPPSKYTEVSSSTVKGLVGFKGWKKIVKHYIHKPVIQAFKTKIK